MADGPYSRGRRAALHVMLADAQLRQGRSDLAIDDLAAARTRWPDDMGLQRRFAVAALLSGQRAEGLRAMDDLIEKKADDESTLTVAMFVLYDAFESGQAIESVDVDRAHMVKLAESYKSHGGQSQALVDT